MPGGQSLKAIERLSFESHTRHPWVNRNLRVPAPISPFQHGKEFRRLFDALLVVTKHTVTSLLAWSRWRADNTNTEPANPTTDDANSNDHELRLQD
jgi:hypothetical protein